jgi:hypothetical protein
MGDTQNSMDKVNKFLPGAYTLGDILKTNGYNQTFIMGSRASFGGRDKLLTQHGSYQIQDYAYAQESGMIAPDYGVWWGYEDKKLFSFAKEELTRLSGLDVPFNLQLLTVDTHFTDGYMDETCTQSFEAQYANVHACSSKQVGEFLSWVRKQPFYDNTTIVLSGDQPGFVALSTVGILVANFYSGSKDSLLKHLSKILKFPPFIAFVIALLLNIFSIEIPKDFDEVLMKLGATTVPLALVSVGSQMQWKKIEKKEGFHLFIGLLFKLVLLPLLILVIYKYIFHQSGDVIDICILEAAMAPMITAAIIASAHDLEPKFCNLMVAVGIPLSILTVGICYLLMIPVLWSW